MIEIKKATMKDADTVLALFEEFMGYHDEVIIRKRPEFKPYLDKKIDSAGLFKEFLVKNINSDDSLVSIALVDGKVAGYSLNYIKENIPIFKVRWLGYMSDLFVRKQFRNLGVSTMLKDEAMSWFKKKGLRYASIQVYNDNESAHDIYRHWGFTDYHVEMRRKI